MKLKLLMAMMVASMFFCSDGYGQRLLDRMMNRSCCDPAPTCCDAPKDNCGCRARTVRFQLRMPSFCGCGKNGGFFNRGCCDTGCDTGCNDGCRGGLLSRLQFGMRLGNRGCGCETPVNDCCNSGCGCGVLSSLRARFASKGCGCEDKCNDDCCGGNLFARFRGNGCGCKERENDCCRVRLVDRLKAMVPSRCGCNNNCGCAGDKPTPAEGDEVEPKADGKNQPSASDGALLRLRATPQAPKTYVSPHRTISIGR